MEFITIHSNQITRHSRPKFPGGISVVPDGYIPARCFPGSPRGFPAGGLFALVRRDSLTYRALPITNQFRCDKSRF